LASAIATIRHVVLKWRYIEFVLDVWRNCGVHICFGFADQFYEAAGAIDSEGSSYSGGVTE
jgi:hypothetical protein